MAETERQKRAREFVAKVRADAEAAGITTLVIGAAVNSDGHDGWQIDSYGPCLSILALISESREWFEETQDNKGLRWKPQYWWKRWLYSPSGSR